MSHVRCHVSRQRGIVAIALTLVLSLFLFSVGILLAVQGNNAIVQSQVGDQGVRAQALAESGVQAGLMRVSRNKDYTGSFTIQESDGSVAASVAGGSPIVITATSTVVTGKDTVKRSIRAEVTLDADGVVTAVVKTNQ